LGPFRSEKEQNKPGAWQKRASQPEKRLEILFEKIKRGRTKLK